MVPVELIGDWLKVAPDSPTGLRWVRSNSKKVKPGDVAGSLTSHGYYQVNLQGKVYKAHRVVLLLSGYTEEDLDGKQVDHVDGVRTNNSLSNLRLCSHRENQHNRTLHRAGKLVGAYFDKSCNSWRSAIRVNGRTKYLGHFPTETLANAAYMAAYTNLKEIPNV